MTRKRSKARNITIASLLVLLVFFLSIFLFRFQQTALGGDKVGITSIGPDNICGSPDDTGVFVENEKICTLIQLDPTSHFASLQHPSVPRIIASGYAYDPTLRGFGCETPAKILELKGLPTAIPVNDGSVFSTHEAFGLANQDFFQCGPFTVLNDKIYNNEPLTVIDNKITQAQAEVWFTVCTDQCPQCSNRQYACERFERTGLTALEFDILPKQTEGTCTADSDCLPIECVPGTPEGECRDYSCIDKTCQLNVPTSTVYTTTIPPAFVIGDGEQIITTTVLPEQLPAPAKIGYLTIVLVVIIVLVVALISVSWFEFRRRKR